MMRVLALLMLVLIAAGLAEVVALELAAEEPTVNDSATPPAAARAATAPPPSPGGFSLPPLRSLGDVTARPLFSQSRRPPPPQASQDALRRSATLVLEGVILSQREHIALISHGLPPVVTRVAEGGEIEGWTLAEIHPDRIVLQHGATQQDIKLVDKTTKPRQPPAPVQTPKP